MDKRKTIKIQPETYENILAIRDFNNYKTISDTIEALIPKGTSTRFEIEHEPPAFEIEDNIISWNMLKKAKNGASWQSKNNEEKAVVIYIDEYGALVRFQFGNEFYVNYFHFL